MSKSFTAISSRASGNNLMVVDSLNLAFRYRHSGQKQFVSDYLQVVESLARSYGATKIVFACDSGASSYRKNLFPEYKANRAELRANQTEAEEQAFIAFIEEFNRTIEYIQLNTDYPVIRFTKTEADDIAAYIVKYKNKWPGYDNIWLISTDRDWDLMVATGKAKRFSYGSRKEFSLENWAEHYECKPEDYISVKCLMGDSGDNVPGIDKVGPKKALDLINTYGSALDVANNIPLPGKYVYIKNTNTFGAEAIFLNYQLMDLLEYCDEAIGADNCKIIDSILGKYLNA